MLTIVEQAFVPVDKWHVCRYCGRPLSGSNSRRHHERTVHERRGILMDDRSPG